MVRPLHRTSMPRTYLSACGQLVLHAIDPTTWTVSAAHQARSHKPDVNAWLARHQLCSWAFAAATLTELAAVLDAHLTVDPLPDPPVIAWASIPDGTLRHEQFEIVGDDASGWRLMHRSTSLAILSASFRRQLMTAANSYLTSPAAEIYRRRQRPATRAATAANASGFGDHRPVSSISSRTASGR